MAQAMPFALPRNDQTNQRSNRAKRQRRDHISDKFESLGMVFIGAKVSERAALSSHGEGSAL
ncbi:hypothetical protein Terro_3403 [Terriglobus roseus DSM 18391]|uniref:Uncharacterized protein n=1 Tax=Terriglobus roseus (strain DSM 18391 / NRRL B-41598 / KBS 63) TaxID=926566 RepID=I3ZK50_TERRK|nr:hypothetical protein Terro_3403 [Terriglobus roseus DSM 18391]